jgi:hypothetical protein
MNVDFNKKDYRSTKFGPVERLEIEGKQGEPLAAFLIRANGQVYVTTQDMRDYDPVMDDALVAYLETMIEGEK